MFPLVRHRLDQIRRVFLGRNGKFGIAAADALAVEKHFVSVPRNFHLCIAAVLAEQCDVAHLIVFVLAGHQKAARCQQRKSAFKSIGNCGKYADQIVVALQQHFVHSGSMQSQRFCLSVSVVGKPGHSVLIAANHVSQPCRCIIAQPQARSLNSSDRPNIRVK